MRASLVMQHWLFRRKFYLICMMGPQSSAGLPPKDLLSSCKCLAAFHIHTPTLVSGTTLGSSLIAIRIALDGAGLVGCLPGNLTLIMVDDEARHAN